MSLTGLLILIAFASTAGTITGFGTSTLMLPVILMFHPLSDALIFVTIIHWFNAIWRLLYFRSGFDLKLVLTFGLSGIVTSIIGAKIVFLVDENILTKLIAVFLLAYSVFLLKNPQFQINFNKRTGIIGGALSGFIAGIFGMGGAIRSAFLAAFNLPKEVYLANSALLLAIIDTSRLLTYFYEKQGVGNLLGMSYTTVIVCILFSFIGVSLGKKIVDKIPQEQFRVIIAIFLMIVAVKLFWC